jgi:type IV pilus assembly protein PilA
MIERAAMMYALPRFAPSEPIEQDELATTEAGFTLIELMVVLLIIAILLAIAIPTFLGVTSSANDRAAQSNLTNGLTEATAQYQNAAQTYSGISASLSASAPEFTWNASAAACTTSTPNCISVEPYDVNTANDEEGVVLAAMSKAGTCWWVAQLQATPQPIASGETSPNVAFETTSTAGNQGYETGASTAGTYYAKQVTSAAGNCQANYPTTRSTGFSWGTSFSNAPNNP